MKKITARVKLHAHTYLLPQDKQIKIVFRGLTHDYPISEIHEALNPYGFQIDYVTQLKLRGNKGNVPLFLVVAPKCKKSVELFNIDCIEYFKVKAEKLRKRPGPAQCFNCLQPCVLKWAGLHKSFECDKRPDTPATCALCKGNRTPNFSGFSRNPRNFVPRSPPPLENFNLK
ncbi:nucleic-acid-binding protein from transposon X-element [Caerostris darwini]|uniref:Nucleic-acid-binding protein from transposon X-element n=1 Tax=Caerostris darwini TaxID=1538125 RepID=A0AAV4NBU0_9ARAC|nr:nucleic-acid-binding protein from transposon X-element [Caerostris darwini]